ncbi:hypothetical protein EZ449_10640 [Pedobacter frigidisoli]|uniref:Uncharacterized protein n=1 Tax=Pedobacter frigidisoli TaxID=2530455 RepID=A0A4R0P3S8_9SPHI|nr:hypothetical protein [Pedobacter frigidisoli]TCD10268.1 hypothetical protein EZ449_10640 [Pedobacter frigidisoli]
MQMIIQKTAENLIDAFIQPHAFTEFLFYLKKEDLEVIKIHMDDFANAKNSTKEIREALQAIHSDENSFILIPRISIKNRLDNSKAFITKYPQYRSLLDKNFEYMIISSIEFESNNLSFPEDEVTFGLEMEFLTKGIQSSDIKLKWTDFYRNLARVEALKWLKDIQK